MHHHVILANIILYSMLTPARIVVLSEEPRYFPSAHACPLTPNLFPKQIMVENSMVFSFSGNSIAQRLSITALSDNYLQDLEVRFVWRGEDRWGERTGVLVFKADGKPKCFFLGPKANIPGNIPVREFILQAPKGISIKEVAFSSIPSEVPILTCPMPGLEAEINQILTKYCLNPKDNQILNKLFVLLERAVPSYDCRRNFDYEPIPAWWMANYDSIGTWIEFLFNRTMESDKHALILFMEFLNTSDGFVGESMAYRFWKLLHDRPLIVLQSWDYLRKYQPLMSWAVQFQPSGAETEIIQIYQDIAAREPGLSSSCEEIIKALRKGASCL